jgi:Family of unknown function (DUF6247)
MTRSTRLACLGGTALVRLPRKHERAPVAFNRGTAVSGYLRVFRRGMRDDGPMTAQPVNDYDPDDPVEILRVLPGEFHGQFLAEYEAAVAGARRPEQYRELHHLLRLWRLRVVAYSDPGYAGRLVAMQESVRSGRRDGTPIEDVVPDWDEKVAAARRRAGG